MMLRKSKFMLFVLLALVLAAFAMPVGAQEATPEAPVIVVEPPDITIEVPPEIVPDEERDGSNALVIGLIITVVVVVATPVILIGAGFVIQRMSPQEARTTADSFERGFELGKQAATKSKSIWDDFGYFLSEPAARQLVKMLRERGEYQAAEAVAKGAGLNDILAEAGSQPHR
jgi:hypothetical protein